MPISFNQVLSRIQSEKTLKQIPAIEKFINGRSNSLVLQPICSKAAKKIEMQRKRTKGENKCWRIFWIRMAEFFVFSSCSRLRNTFLITLKEIKVINIPSKTPMTWNWNASLSSSEISRFLISLSELMTSQSREIAFVLIDIKDQFILEWLWSCKKINQNL